jgi:hypothetical protein
MEPTDYAHLSWDAFQRTRDLALRRMRPDGAPPNPGQVPPPPPAVARTAIVTAAPDSGHYLDTQPRTTEPPWAVARRARRPFGGDDLT